MPVTCVTGMDCKLIVCIHGQGVLDAPHVPRRPQGCPKIRRDWNCPALCGVFFCLAAWHRASARTRQPSSFLRAHAQVGHGSVRQ